MAKQVTSHHLHQWCHSSLAHICVTRSLFYWYGLTLIPAWISNYIPGKVWEWITYPFSNFKSCTIEVWEWISNFIPHFIMDVITYPWEDWSSSKLVTGATCLISKRLRQCDLLLWDVVIFDGCCVFVHDLCVLFCIFCHEPVFSLWYWISKNKDNSS